MTFRRKIYNKLLEWKSESDGKSAVLIEGARRVGKSTIAEEFARNEYDDYILLDFALETRDTRRNFEDNIGDLDTFFRNLFIIKGKELPRRRSVIIFDEVQLFPMARQAIKYLVADGRYDYIEIGSLISIKKNVRNILIPSEEEKLKMFPMDFEEFLWAKGIDEKVIDYLKECFSNKKPVSEATHNAMLRYFREYLCVGGLPYIVSRFVETNDMNVVWQEQQDILEEYKDDFGKHLDEDENEEIDRTLLGRINRVFDSIPAQLAKENKKFVYSSLEKKGRSEAYQNAIQWLYDCGIINLCHNLTNISAPLDGYKIENTFKIYMQDSGLFVAMLEKGCAAKILSGDLGFYKGAIYENIVADCFSKQGRNLYYFRKDSGLEIDFVETIAGETALIEVKATSGQTKSAKTVLQNENYEVDICYKLSENNVGVVGKVVTLPYYMTMFLE
jgi:predicted AAA+ superfamily ATPase